MIEAGAPLEARVGDLPGRMTLEEKVAQMLCVWQQKAAVQNAGTSFSPEKAARAYPHRIGMFARPSDRQLGAASAAGDAANTAHRGPRETAEYVNAVQKRALGRTRLGIPLFMHEDALHGYVARDATSFPQAIGLASSFDPALRAQGRVAQAEDLADGRVGADRPQRSGLSGSW